MLKKIICVVLFPLGVLGAAAVSETDVSGSDTESSARASLIRPRVRTSEAVASGSFNERRERISALISKLQVVEEESRESIQAYLLEIPTSLWENIEGSTDLLAVNLRKLTKKHYPNALENMVHALSDVCIRFQERSGVLTLIVQEGAMKFSERLKLRVGGVTSPQKVSRSAKKRALSDGFFSSLFAEATGVVLDRKSVIPSTTWAQTMAAFYGEGGSPVRALEVFMPMRAEEKAWYEHMTVVNSMPDLEFLELLGRCPEASQGWVQRMVARYSSDRIPLNSLKMAKWFLTIPLEFQPSIAAILETFLSGEFSSNKDSQARMVNLFMKKVRDPKTAYISYFVNIIGFLGRDLTVELAEKFVEQLTTSGWRYVERKIQLFQTPPKLQLDISLLEELFREGLNEASRTEDL